MKLKREAKTLKSKSLASLRRGLEAFNSHDDIGRPEVILLLLQHASEMLTKALLVQKDEDVFDKEKGTSIGLERSLKIGLSKGWLTVAQVGSIRVIDAMRDQAQHWMIVVPEDALYINARALITTLDEILSIHFGDSLADHLPLRVLPLSTLPIPDFIMLINREYAQIRELLAPGRRARDEARGRITALLAMEAHVSEEVSVSKRDLDRIEDAIKSGTQVEQVFPRLMTLATDVSGEGPTIRVRITKAPDAPGIRYVSGDDPEGAAAIREVDLQRKYHLSPSALAVKLGLNTSKAKAVRDFLKVDEDPANVMVFEFGSQKHPRYSDNALRVLKAAISPELVERAWRERAGRR
ncbi:hypothetical protein BJD12_00195 [Xanthomonas vesicatoria ATCC 35937]|uniref:Uncharacterized protein n=1 Tax=Xanthomonas vesicatoria ATCC 35937 TaxID=925775 RepID=F0BFR3_9XANT|nr:MULTISPECIES: hypothetical protein [Xanthomonas]APP73935.1 hypothetical protein BJD12_00195 [Xanthomonas vesicatoria ATCC 35937]EGD07371.1 hypothetical protein XVE_4441 [Xanthomonas vesicatoria ATCC 35937]EGD08693.1 hypothetical protein XVE_3077 [Xanthomonas vesicatoria ATCC 35937]MCC8597081.1 hypothetical protein [Xanthomonas vesicatoria]MCC8605429.1 hypothetical protein [Xanthomonas vesicatoria]